jgi:hypothetical protein
MQAISKIKWKCHNDRIDTNGSPICVNPYNERIFDPPLLRLDGLKLGCDSCFEPAPDVVEPIVFKEWLNYIIIQVQDDDSPFVDYLQKMTTFVYDEYVGSIRIGESVKIHGNLGVPLKSYEGCCCF